MIFSKMRPWQGNPAVQQVLVFPSVQAENRFTDLFAQTVNLCGIEWASDSDLGASYKLRAVKNGKGSYDAVLRCGVTGCVILELFESFEEPKQAIAALVVKLSHFANAAAIPE